MATSNALVLAGVAGGGTGGGDLAWFGPEGTTAPTSASATLNVGFLSPGWITEDGLTRGVDEDSTDIPAFGSGAPVRTIVNSSKVTFQIAFLESNPVALAIYHRLALDALEPDEDGALDFTEGASRTARYAAVFDIVDGDNHIRAYCPSVEVTDRQEFSVGGGEAITYGVTLTAYPGGDGTAVHWFYVLGALSE